jgi:hypothetical protein
MPPEVQATQASALAHARADIVQHQREPGRGGLAFAQRLQVGLQPESASVRGAHREQGVSCSLLLQGHPQQSRVIGLVGGRAVGKHFQQRSPEPGIVGAQSEAIKGRVGPQQPSVGIKQGQCGAGRMREQAQDAATQGASIELRR